MAEGGAWQSDVFDNGRDFHHGDDKPPTTSPVPGVPAAMYNPPAAITSGRDGAHMPIISIALRCATIVFTTVAFAVIASNQGSEASYCGDGIYCYIGWKAVNTSNLAYLLAIDCIVCVYSIVQLVLSLASPCIGRTVLQGPNTPAATITYVCDQVLAYMLMAGCGTGAATSIFYKNGESGAVSCSDGFSIFCDKIAASVAVSFVAFLCIALSAAMAYYRLHRIARKF